MLTYLILWGFTNVYIVLWTFEELSAVYEFWCSRSYDLWLFKNIYETQADPGGNAHAGVAEEQEEEALVAVQQLIQHGSCECGACTRSRSRQVALEA